MAVAVGAAVATVHGLYEVAVAAGVPGPIAWLYPLITDGLALVAYTATARLTGSARRYAWLVVALAAGLSGLAQAAYLAGAAEPTAVDMPPVGEQTGTSGSAGFEAAPALRFGVGAWPAVAAAIVAHLLFLLAVDHPAAPAAANGVRHSDPVPQSANPADTTREQDTSTADRTHRPSPRPAVSVPVSSGEQAGSVSGGVSEVVSPPSSSSEVSGAVGRAPVSERPATVSASPARDRARAAALAHHQQTGALPSVRELTRLAEVSRGTAADALTTLRATTRPLHLITNADAATPTRHTQP
ncbi:DUF2637 domain-containing protein [Pseudonocardia humida]|uniref:DUF2637 domain-containing protein n=1 Tax=Pseudonocardia humida TaxID=2800819 RepID=A0ABT1A7B0_9PSEU|nr:DUF2637 domain-containing protein [Pseudonocardia humida]MCO1658900.1 DUF2637 domain-containing protein [Pseudonocardia humida]